MDFNEQITYFKKETSEIKEKVNSIENENIKKRTNKWAISFIEFMKTAKLSDHNCKRFSEKTIDFHKNINWLIDNTETYLEYIEEKYKNQGESKVVGSFR